MGKTGSLILSADPRDLAREGKRYAQFLGRFTRVGARIRGAEEGASAVEFAIIAPVFILLIFGIIIYGTVLASYIAVQQLAAEAARASVGGLSATERTTLAQNYVSQNLAGYPLINPKYLSIATNPQANTFGVTVTYNMAKNPIFRMAGGIPLPATTIHGNAVVQNGGY
ncbi:MAG TPA: TadE/TadG family type IV pilus assembly protein [Methylovirgula sp.]|jgi:Flp pilus assembly protein TadG|nr:TadE/TadG family type IV pilus assembly protein [Methylovirgula sp.]